MIIVDNDWFSISHHCFYSIIKPIDPFRDKQIAMQKQSVSKAIFSEVLELVDQGKFMEAEDTCRDAVNQNPDEVNMLALLGATLIKTKKYSEAEKYLRMTVDLAPTFAKPHEDLGYLLLKLKRPDEAIEVLEKATRLDPGLELAFLTLGKALAETGKGKEADEAFEKAFSLSPERKALAHASECYKEGQIEEAEKICRKVVQKNPSNVEALRLLGIMSAGLGREGDAERFFRKALKIAPDFTGVIVDLGQLMSEEGRFEEAIDCYKQAIKMEPENPRHYDHLGWVFEPAALTYDAIEAHQKAIELNPRLASAWLGLGHGLKTVGRLEEAIEAYHQCYKLKPLNGAIQWSLANLKTYRFTDEEIADMQEKITKENLSEESKVNFLFALAKAYEDRNDYDRAWNYYREGNSKRRMLEIYDPVETEIKNDSVIKVFNKAFLESNTGIGNPDPSPIFVVGLPRSGSTLIEQILASHSLVEGTTELNYIAQCRRSLNRNRADGINYPDAVSALNERHFKALGQDYLNLCQMHRIEGTPYFIDKMPNNFPNIGLIHLILPNAKIIDARRHPMDACFSGYRQLFARGQPYTYDLTDIGEYYLQYQRLMDHWHEVLPGRVLTVQYEDVVFDFENQVYLILEYCGLPREDSCLNYYDTDRPVRTPSSEQVRQPIYMGSLNRWRKYEQYLGELKEVLCSVTDRYEKYETQVTN